jgi:D-sedoheptulose 7-phosphate isomerase
MKTKSDAVLNYLEAYRKETLSVLERIPLEGVASLVGLLEEANREGRQVFLCGNGGSAATASHLANDLGKGASGHRKRRFRVLSLTDNVPWMTAVANDLDYSQIFVEQLRNFARPGDLLICFSGSGESENVLEAVRWANENDVVTIGFCGAPGGRLAEMARHVVRVETGHMGRIEESHFFLQHLLGYYFMETPDPKSE